MLCLKCLTEIKDKTTARYGLHKECFRAWFDAPEDAKFISLQRMPSAFMSDETSNAIENSSFFQGKFKKYSAQLNDHTYIFKMRQAQAPELPEVEYVCNQIAKSLNIPIAEFYFIRFNNDAVFATKNFITHANPTSLQHIKHFRSNDQHTCEGLIKTILKTTHQPCDINTFIKTILFDSLIGNHDRHGRNLAFISTQQRTMLSPIYDNVSYLSLEKGNMLKADFNPTGKITTHKSSAPNMFDYVIELKKLEYLQEIQQFYHQIKLPVIFKLIDDSFCSALMKTALKKLIQKRFEELGHALSTKT
ncbi:MAG: hypothetical protein A3I77_06785 [Gammaproteobacteria bacterium RIFCSPLOWO2_02_FULL_42_14]|nr:MAG: hypothetical protein A3B71_02620 [Gammaproteobacteria bacterium RIFCSPHIGHO2_02_FULL_42_43]OGT28002.1 MAG: hypothetical protein A2624_03935 [Gammaproteobacteria bacterium RIFCSPHIGHO2_01_FULL_42_8]OGT51966.1 MAG: hypothetical protein A3E54_04125 [Gammaproteobacteria bacterium RIFCSPHIGHO2_12_FULL_41_25]OGT61071.1 MAG: hypothetical protein A3I77_06785 [Gammaproteobacteria bacterium RIFCSPLOWO2_02_FULL_42_14]OGT86999.1 MAG: hypothetical protein A3G86_00505 [Gammaproteobacteria bacterium R